MIKSLMKAKINKNFPIKKKTCGKQDYYLKCVCLLISSTIFQSSGFYNILSTNIIIEFDHSVLTKYFWDASSCFKKQGAY